MVITMITIIIKVSSILIIVFIIVIFSSYHFIIIIIIIIIIISSSSSISSIIPEVKTDPFLSEVYWHPGVQGWEVGWGMEILSHQCYSPKSYSFQVYKPNTKMALEHSQEMKMLP